MTLIEMAKSNRRRAARFAAGLVALPLLAATAAAVPSQPDEATAVDPANEDGIARVLASLRTECERYTQTAAAEDVEAAFAFRLSQAIAVDAEAIRAALLRLARAQDVPLVCRLAAGNLQVAYAGQGTGSIPGGSGFGSSSTFTPPLVTLGGGTSNYAR